MRYRFAVTLEAPAGLDPDYMRDYVASAVATMMGCHHPADPILQTRRVTAARQGASTSVNVGYTFYDPDYDA